MAPTRFFLSSTSNITLMLSATGSIVQVNFDNLYYQTGTPAQTNSVSQIVFPMHELEFLLFQMSNTTPS